MGTDAAREYTDREIRRVARELSTEYGRLGDEQAGAVLDFLTERAVDGVVPESALQGRDWARLRSEVARSMSDRNRASAEAIGGRMDTVRDLTAGDAPAESRVPRPAVDRRRDLTWNERHVEAAARAAVGRDPSVAARGVRDLADMNRNAAVRKARTAINGAENAGRMDAMLARGGSKRWVAVMDERTRASHADMNGEVVPVEEPFSNGLMYPGDPSGPPEEVYNCRCTMEWVDTSGEVAPDGRAGTIEPDTVTPENDETMRYAVSKLNYVTPTVETDEDQAYWHEAYSEAFSRNSAHHMSANEATRLASSNINTYIGREAYDAGSVFFGPDNYQAIQRGLRTGDLSEEVSSMVRDIDRAIDLGDTLNFDTALIRYESGSGIAARMGISAERFYDLSDDDLVSALTGTVMTDPGYSSTAFAPLRSVVTEEADVVMNIVARSGTSALIREGAQESEVLLGRGTRFHIVGVRPMHATEYVEWEDDYVDVRHVILDVVV